MLKYLDIALLVGSGIKCPACKGTRCHRTGWRSKHEKMSSEGYRPYRCDDCTNRFLAANGAALERHMINGAAAAILTFGVLTAVELWPGNVDQPAAEHLALSSTTETEESTAGAVASDTRRHPEDQVDNINLLQKAADSGDAEAMVKLGRIFASGDKLPKDLKQAAKWVQLAAATGNAKGMVELGRFYRDGIGLAQNSVRAYVWFSRAAAANHADAMQERDDLVRAMSGDKLKEAQKLSLPTEPVAGMKEMVKK